MSVAGAAVAAYGLPSAHSLERADRSGFGALLAECERERVTGLLARAVRDGRLAIEDDQREQLEDVFRAWLTHALRVEQLLLGVTRELDRAAIETRVLKGVALSHTAYPDPSDRVFGDVDLLVPGHQLRRAAEVVGERFDAPRPQPELRPGFDDRFGKEVMLRVRGIEVDLHRTFVEGAYGLTVQLGDLFAPPYRFPLGGYEFDALPQPQRLLHACYAAALGDWPPRLMSLRDVAQLILKEQPHIVDVLTMARSWRAEAVVARAIVTTWDVLALTQRPPLVNWAFNYAPGRTDRMLLAAHEGPARAFTRHAAAVVVLPDVDARLAYLHAIVFPQRSYLEARGLSAGAHAKRAWRRIVR
jgi:hypothetical protein